MAKTVLIFFFYSQKTQDDIASAPVIFESDKKQKFGVRLMRSITPFVILQPMLLLVVFKMSFCSRYRIMETLLTTCIGSKFLVKSSEYLLDGIMWSPTIRKFLAQPMLSVRAIYTRRVHG